MGVASGCTRLPQVLRAQAKPKTGGDLPCDLHPTDSKRSSTRPHLPAFCEPSFCTCEKTKHSSPLHSIHETHLALRTGIIVLFLVAGSHVRTPSFYGDFDHSYLSTLHMIGFVYYRSTRRTCLVTRDGRGLEGWDGRSLREIAALGLPVPSDGRGAGEPLPQGQN